MESAEFSVYVVQLEAGYAGDIENHGGQTHEAALKKARDDMAAALPQGLETPGQLLYVVEAASAAVGHLWVAKRSSGGREVLFIYDISIEPEWQARGYGRAAMLGVEGLAREMGVGHIELNVFGRNDVARRLYTSLGYVETSVQMRKTLDGRGPDEESNVAPPDAGKRPV